MASNDREHEQETEEDTGGEFAPIVKLEQVSVTTGVEDEEAILNLTAKLYRFDKYAKGWKERGDGSIKFLKHKKAQKFRIVMHQSKTLIIRANHHVLSAMSVQKHTGNSKSCVWHAADFSDGELNYQLFCIRFGSLDDCKKFMETFQEVSGSQTLKPA